MAIAAQRFKFLDKETNLPTTEFAKLADNAIYNVIDSVSDTAIALAKEAEDLLSKVTDSIGDLKDMLENASKEVLSMVKDALNKAMDLIGKMELPAFIKNAFNKLKELDLTGVKDFVKDLLHVGTAFLCNNLDFLKMFMLGFALNRNILSGLLVGLLLSWMDRICKGFTPEEQKSFKPLQALEKVIPPVGAEITTGNVFNTFNKSLASLSNASAPLSITEPLDPDSFLSKIKLGEVTSSMGNLRQSEISFGMKNDYLQRISNELTKVAPNSQEYKHLLSAKGSLTNLPLISVERRDKSIRFSNLSDQLGDMAKKIVNIDVANISTGGMNNVSKSLQTKLVAFKENVQNNPDVLTRTGESGSFNDFDFGTIMPELTDEEKTQLASLKFEDTAHRTHDMHPTTAVFLEA